MKNNEIKREAVLYGLANFLVPALMFVFVCAVLKITPFGDKTFLYEDMKQQYVDFFTYYKAVFHGQDGFLTSENCGLGSSMTGIWTYYLTSPFLLPFVWVPERLLPTAVTVLIGVKLSMAGLTMGSFLGSITDRKNIVVIFSTAYAFSAWMVANMSNTMWIDGAIMLPLIALAYLNMLRRGRKGVLLYAISVVVTIYVNYYIAAMILIFLFIFTMLGLCLREIDIKQFGRFMLGSALSVLADLWLLIPVVLSLRGSNKDHAGDVARAFGNFLPSSEAVARNISPVDVISKLFCLSYDSIEIMEGFPNIYFGTVLVLPMLLFFINKKIKRSHRIMAFLYTAVLMAFFCISELDKLAHGGTRAYGYLYRYSFLFSFICLIMGLVCIAKAEGLSVGKVLFCGIFEEILLAIAYLGGVRFLSAKVLMVNSALVMTAMVLMSIEVYIANNSASSNGEAGGDPAKRDGSGASGAEKGFDSETAEPENGLESGTYGAEKGFGSILLRMVRCIAILVVAAELMFNFIWIYRSQAMNATSVSDYNRKVAGIEKALDDIDKVSKENGIADRKFRIENYERRTPNDGLHFGYRSVSTYNSLLKVEDRVLLYRMGFNDNGLYAEYGAGNTRTADALLGIRYIIAGDEYEPAEGQKRVSANVLENVTALDYGSYITGADTKGLIKYIDSKLDPAASPFDVQSLLWKKHTGENSEIFVNAEVAAVDDIDADGEMVADDFDGPEETVVDDGVASEEMSADRNPEITNETYEDMYRYKITAQADGEMYFYMNKNDGVDRNIAIYLDGEFLTGYGNASSQKVVRLGYHHKGESIVLGIIPDEDGKLPSDPVVVTEIVNSLIF